MTYDNAYKVDSRSFDSGMLMQAREIRTDFKEENTGLHLGSKEAERIIN